ncbi:hypothetical protein PR202_ga23527 [Eleusine coracana subsp. coracana]|uniref:Uncharacterized protein n=1 Tax=Eleusine coracana subsp. coracana TaxID=191504 RepID=A0AAV5D6R6_ELECO|nr:hypothetical protein PR202_ga23527 [Eleusine coracana subsp. coracana]
MCLKIEAWLCFGPGPDQEDDYCYSSAKGGSLMMSHHHNHHHHAGGGPSHDQRDPYAHHANGRAHRQLPVAADEEDRKASNDARRGHATKDVHAQEKAYAYSAGNDGLLRHPATNVRGVADAAGHGAHYYYQQREPAHTGEYYRYH